MHQIDECIRKTYECSLRLNEDVLKGKLKGYCNDIALRNAFTIGFIAVDLCHCHNLGPDVPLALYVCTHAYTMALRHGNQGWQHVFHDICNEYETARVVRERIEKK